MPPHEGQAKGGFLGGWLAVPGRAPEQDVADIGVACRARRRLPPTCGPRVGRFSRQRACRVGPHPPPAPRRSASVARPDCRRRRRCGWRSAAENIHRTFPQWHEVRDKLPPPSRQAAWPSRQNRALRGGGVAGAASPRARRWLPGRKRGRDAAADSLLPPVRAGTGRAGCRRSPHRRPSPFATQAATRAAANESPSAPGSLIIHYSAAPWSASAWNTTSSSSARARRTRGGDPPEATRGAGGARTSPSASSKKARRSARISCRARCSSRARSTSCFPIGARRGAPLKTPATEDRLLLLTARRALRLPTPPQMRNHGNYIISLGNLCRWLAAQAEALGVEIYPGFAGAEVLYDESGRVARRRDRRAWASARTASRPRNFQPGVELRAQGDAVRRGLPRLADQAARSRVSICAGTASRRPMASASRSCGRSMPRRHQPGLVIHTIGWPLDRRDLWRLVPLSPRRIGRSPSGSWSGSITRILISARSRSSSASRRIRRFAAVFEGGRRIAYGARAFNEGGFQSIPRLDFPGGLLIGDAAGFLNVPKIKGSHTAMKSGMVAAETVFRRLAGDDSCRLPPRARGLAGSGPSFTRVRNIRPGFRVGPVGGARLCRRSTLISCAAARRGLCASTPIIEHLEPRQRQPADRLSQARRQDHLRPAVFGVHLRTPTMKRTSRRICGCSDPAQAIAVNYALYDSPETALLPGRGV